MEFIEFLKQNEKILRSNILEDLFVLDTLEKELSVSLHKDFRYFMTTYGYSDYCGVSNLYESIQLTKDTRIHLKLPHKYVVLYDHGDGGLILLDTISEKMRVVNTGYESIPDQLDAEIIYESYQEYIVDDLIEMYS